VTATVCRLSGKLATGSCLDVDTVDSRGNTRRGSQVYTEHFVSGSEPHEYCEEHRRFGNGVLGAIAAALGGGPDPAPAPAPVATGSVAAVAPTGATPVTDAAGTPATEPAPTEEPKKRRGFWSRIFR
jgi:hypothetical protein